MSAIMAFAISCGEDEDPTPSSEFDAPTASAGAVADLIEGESGTATFTVSIDSDLTGTWAATSSGGITLTATSGDISGGSVEVGFDAITAGAASVTLTVTDSESQSASATTTAFNVVGEAAPEVVVVSGIFTEDVTWTADKIYELAGRVVVDSAATLTIEPGTIIKGREGEGAAASALLIARYGKIEANGTGDAPIIFTSVIDNIMPGQTVGTNLSENENGLWGGLLILGNAPISADASSEQIEGIPADFSFGLYGGENPADNSGSLNYVSVRHGGSLIGEGNEINGITLGGVGSGTSITNIEVVGNKDDGVEWFGGNVNVTNLLIWAADDDGIDIDQAYSGTIDNAVVIAFDGTDHGLEIDGPEGALAGSFTIQNLTVKGFNDELGQYRDGATGTTSNAYFFGFQTIAEGEGDLSLDDATTLDGLTFSGLQVTLPADASAITDVLADGIDAFGSTVDQGANTVGADTSVFGWTMASEKGALDF